MALRNVLSLRVVALALIFFGGSSLSSQAAPEGVIGWCVPLCNNPTPGASYCTDNPYDACVQERDHCNSTATLIGPVDSNVWYSKTCKWVGGGHVLPGPTTFECAAGYYRQAYNRCIRADDGTKREQPRCPKPAGSRLNPSTPNPISLITGAKSLEATDFETADGLLKVKRQWRSIQSGGTFWSAAPPIGMGLNWRFAFFPELQIYPNYNAYKRVSLHWSDGSGFDFERDSSGNMNPLYQTGVPFSEMQLSLVGGVWPANTAAVSNWIVTDSEGSKWEFQTWNSIGWNPPYNVVGHPMKRTTKDGYVWTYTYGPGNDLQTIVDSFGRTLTFTWHWKNPNTIPGVSGQPVTPDAISQIGLPDGTKLVYIYTSLSPNDPLQTYDVLVRVERQDATGTVLDSTDYHHEDTNFKTFITGITDGRGVRAWNYSYDARGRALVSERAGGVDRYSVSYSGDTASPPYRFVTNPLGKQTKYRYNDRTMMRLLGIDGIASTSCPADFQTISYSTAGWISSTTDQEGRVTNYTRDTKGRPLTIVEAAGTPDARTTTMTWHATLNLPLSIVKPGLTTTYTYSTSGSILTKTETDTTTHTVPYVTAGRTRTWTYTYTAQGLLDTIDGPLPGAVDVVDYDYDSNGYLTQVTNEMGHVTDVVSVNGRGQPTEIEDPNGVSTLLDYDDVGRLVSIVRNPGVNQAETLLEYDGAGDLTKVTRPDGSWLEYTYDDAQRVETIESNTGESIEYTYNAAKQPTAIDVKSSTGTIVASRQMVYDELKRLRQFIGGELQQTLLTYDKVDNLATMTDPESNLYDYDSDRLDRLIRDTDPDLGQTNYTYDARDNLTSVRDALNRTTTYVVDGFGDVIRETSPDTGTTDYVRNQLGLITSMTDARGVTVNFTFDSLGRLTAKAFPASSTEDVTFTYDSTAGGNFGVGHLTSVTNLTGTTDFTWDALGRMVGTQRTYGLQSYVTAYEYDAANRLTGLVYPSGRIVMYDRDQFGRIASVTTRASTSDPVHVVASDIKYRPFQSGANPADTLGKADLSSPAELESLTYGNGLELLYGHDLDGRLTNMQVSDGMVDIQDLTLDYDANGNLLSLADNLDSGRTQTFAYDDLNRLAYADGSYGEIDYAYDISGNRTSRAIDTGTVVTETYAYQTGTSRISTISNGSHVRTFGYLANGAVATDARANANFAATYNQDGRLATLTADAGPMASRAYRYDAFGMRVSADHEDRLPPPGGIQVSGRAYAYDLTSHLLAEYEEATGSAHTSSLEQEFIWIGDVAIALVHHDAPEEILYVHSDRLGRPARISNNSLATVWDGQFTPFEEEQVVTTTFATPMPLRLPGQEWDVGTGLLHDKNGEYDPSIARSLSVDPVSAQLIGGPWTPTPQQVATAVEVIPILALPEAWPFIAGGVVMGGIVAGYHAYCDAQDDAERKKREGCEALRRSILETCARLKGRKKFRCFAAAQTSYRQCMGWE